MINIRYLGNKESIMPEIEKLLSDKGLIRSKKLTFFDAFCGSGSVSDGLKDLFDIIINDNLKWSVIYTKGRVCAHECTFETLGFDPFIYFNSNNHTKQGFVYTNYSPGGSERMYFTSENASRIDYFREEIENWKKQKLINENEYCYLLACLIESVSDVSNTAGVYGAYLKKWDSRALKKIVFDKVDSKNSTCSKLTVYNDKIENIISDINCDVLYLDPPYTQNQYGTQYHLLETLILDDSPEISRVTGSRKTAPMRSDWSKEYKAQMLFNKILAETKAKYIVFSYNNDGIMSKDYIEASMKRYGIPETYCCKKISYKKYQNWKSNNQKKHFEYLFFVEKKDINRVRYESPLNYIGSKAKVIDQIIEYLPEEYNNFIDAFGGGFNVGINMCADEIIYNDLNYLVKQLIQSFKENDTYDYLMYINKTIKRFGLEKGNRDSYCKAREYYNSLPPKDRDPKLLYTIIMYGYQQQIRFNGKHDFNNPVGMRWFNDKVMEKMISFSQRIKEKNIRFESCDYKELEEKISQGTFVYLDPPYMLTTGAYNDGKRGFNGWNKDLEKELFKFVDLLDQKSIKFMLSYVLEHKNKKNDVLEKWINDRGYHLIQLGDIIGISGSKRKEVLVINYDAKK